MKNSESNLAVHATAPSIGDEFSLPVDPGIENARILAIVSTFTAEPVQDSLQFWLGELSMAYAIRFAGYNQVFQELLNPGGLLGTNRSGNNVLMIRLEDWLPAGPADETSVINRNVDDLIAGVKDSVARNPAPCIIVVCPVSPKVLDAGARLAVLQQGERRLASGLAGVPGLHFVSSEQLSSLYPVSHFYDAKADEFGHVPYTPAGFAALGTIICRYLHVLSRPAYKVVVLDCDNTLWSGVCGEDGAKGIRLEQQRHDLQAFMKRQKDAGLLLCLASKNNEGDVAEVFACRPEMPLRWEDFGACRINWNPKSQNLAELAAELNLGLGSFIFIDDNPAECAEVGANCPEVLVLQLPEDPECIPLFLDHCWVFDRVGITAEDRRRTELYQQARQRKELQKSSLSFAGFIHELELKIVIQPVEAGDIPRIAQLTQRTNQFNFTTRRRSEAEIGILAASSDYSLLGVRVSDRFGDYGLVGLMICCHTGEELQLDSFLLSCRVLGRGVEHRMFASIGELAQEKTCRWVRVQLFPTARNQPAFRFMEIVGTDYRLSNGDESSVFRFPAEVVSKLKFDPELVASQGEAAAARELEASPKEVRSLRISGDLVNRIAKELNEVGQILRRIENRSRAARPDISVRYVPPRNEDESKLAEIWCRVLGVSQAGIHDNFFELGGNSILSMKVVYEMNEAFQADLSLAPFFANPTISFLAEALRKTGSSDKRQANGLDESKSGGDSDTLVTCNPAERYEPFALTDIQAAYWIGRGDSFAMGNTATHLYWETEVAGIDLARFEQVWQMLIDRHDMLRAVVLADGRQQVLEKVAPFKIRIQDLTKETPPVAENILSAVRQEMSHQILPSHQAPLFEIRIYQLAQNRCRVHFSFDLLVVDAWSLQVLQAEFSQLYAQPQKSLVPLSLTFRDYVVGSSRLRDSEASRRSQEYWEKRLKSLPLAPELPLLKSAEAVRRPMFSRRTEMLPADLWSSLNQKAAKAGITANGVLLAAYTDVLATWARRPHFLLNLTLFNRLPLHPQTEKLVGDFTSTTLLEVNVASADTFLEHAMKLRNQLLTDLDHRHFSGIQVMRKLAREQRDSSIGIAPFVFTSTLGFNKDEPFPCFLAGEGRVVYRVTQTPQVALDNIIFEEKGTLHINWDVVDELFPPGMIDDMFQSYVSSVKRLATEDAAWTAIRAVRGEALLPGGQATQRRQINQTGKPFTRCLLHELFEEQAQKTPGQIAVVNEEFRITYQQLVLLSRKLGRQLREMGAKPNTLVAMVMEKGWEQVAAALAILQSGAAYVPIDGTLPRERLFELLENAQANLVLTQPCLDEALSWPDNIKRLCVGKKLLADLGPEEPLGAAQLPEDLAYVIYTSGSTGLPKGVMIDHLGAVNTILDINDRFGVNSKDSVLALSSMSFDLSVYDVFGLLAAGGTIVIPEAWATRDPARWDELIRKEGITLWDTVPALMEMLVEFVSGRSARLSGTLRLVMMSGDWIPLALPGQIRAVSDSLKIISLGGATEASIWSILYPIETLNPAWKSIPYGRPMVNQTFHVLNDLLETCPVWNPGHLYIGGIGLAKGYWRDEAKSAAKFINHPTTGERLYQTGDLGRFLPEGDIEFLGREDFQVKIRGFRIELGEIEAAFKKHPAVRSIIVTAFGKTNADRGLAAYVVLDRNKLAESIPAPLTKASQSSLQQTESFLKEFLAEKLPEHMIPSVIIPLDKLPLTPNGKVDLRSLPKPQVPRSGKGDAQSAPRTEIEKVLAGIWQDLLQVEHVGVHDDFFALGGDSVKAIQLVSRANKKGYQLMPIMLFRHSTISDLAQEIGTAAPSPSETTKGVRPASIYNIEGSADGIPVLFINPGYWDGYLEMSLASKLSSKHRVVSVDIPLPADAVYAAATNAGAPYYKLEEVASGYVALIRSHGITGPCVVTGFSFGAIVAYEVAQQLNRAGIKVEAMLLLDSWLIWPKRWWTYKLLLRQWLQRQNTRAENRLGFYLLIPWNLIILIGQGMRYVFQRICRHLKIAKEKFNAAKDHEPVVAPLSDEKTNAAAELPWDIAYESIIRTMVHYRIRPINCRGVLFRSQISTNPYREYDGTQGAGGLFKKGLRIVEVPGDHHGIFEGQNLDRLAEHVSNSLDEIKSNLKSDECDA